MGRRRRRPCADDGAHDVQDERCAPAQPPPPGDGNQAYGHGRGSAATHHYIFELTESSSRELASLPVAATLIEASQWRAQRSIERLGELVAPPRMHAPMAVEGDLTAPAVLEAARALEGRQLHCRPLYIIADYDERMLLAYIEQVGGAPDLQLKRAAMPSYMQLHVILAQVGGVHIRDVRELMQHAVATDHESSVGYDWGGRTR
jgi:hypothetical protein